MTDSASTTGVAGAKEILGHPRGLATLFFTEMWERLSYYGMRAILILFMVDQMQNGGLQIDDVTATAIYGIYTAAVYLVALPGGWIADRLIGAQRAVLAGGVVIMSGHFVLAIPGTNSFYLGLLLVILGTGLLKPNVSTIVGTLYPPGDERRDSGFSIFYMGINMGGFLGPIVCGYLAQNPNFGWHWGFAAAGVGMLFGVVQFWMTRSSLGSAGLHPASSGNEAKDALARKRGWIGVLIGLAILAYFFFGGLSGSIAYDPVEISRKTTFVILGSVALYFVYLFTFGRMSTEEKKRVGAIIVLFLGISMFWSGFEQAGSSLNLFAQRYTQLEFGWFTIYASIMQSLNSLFIIIFAPVFAWMWIWLGKRHLNPSTPLKFGFGLILLAVGFSMMIIASTIVASGELAMPTWLILTYLFHTFGELAISPVGMSATTKLAPQRYVGQMMGIWFVGAALGNLIAGQVAGDFDADNLAAFPDQYWQIVMTIGGAGLIFVVLTKPIRKLMSGIH
ncbi:MAG: peptide MFS transporter [Gammaproteobacteria bacterium]|nr:peptide MFS transporter [Gammaproteobacteria bacterium]MDH4316399.1 peptide MFS transporter [Gammaproteobacteria bacterium]MDH5215363.1 peptide MFS transporter [Gammaproteobacteria bacterium]